MMKDEDDDVAMVVMLVVDVDGDVGGW